MSGTGMNTSYSKYYEQLDGHAQARYREKLDMAGLTSDPYNSKNFMTDSQLWPEIETTLISTTTCISLAAQVSTRRSK